MFIGNYILFNDLSVDYLDINTFIYHLESILNLFGTIWWKILVIKYINYLQNWQAWTNVLFSGSFKIIIITTGIILQLTISMIYCFNCNIITV